MEMVLTKLTSMEIFDPRSKIVFNHMTWPMRTDIFSALANELVGQYSRLKDYPKVTALLKKAQEGRNKVIHGNWGIEDGKVTYLRATARGELKLKMDEITVKELEAILNDINVAAAALYNLVLGS
jgi:hypothetical protein